MILRVRRALVIGGVIASLVLGLFSIRIAAQLAAAAAPPPAPPVSIEDLQRQLAAEQARAATLESDLDELLGLSGDLTLALSKTEDQVSADGLTAKQLRDRLKAAEAKLASVSSLLRKARARLAALQQAASNARSGGANGGSGGGGGGGGGGSAATPRPPSSGGMSLALSIAGGGVRADWSACTASGFAGYALVRSRDGEIHWPPESGDTEVARISSRTTTVATDSSAPSGSVSYQVFCLYRHDSDTEVATATAVRRISVP
jgi:hypothetical protein